MKVLMLNGSPNENGNTYQALEAVGRQLAEEGLEYEIFQLGKAPIRDCVACGKCSEAGCIFTDDKVNEFIAKGREADGLVLATPVYYAHPTGRILSFLDRVFFAGSSAFTFKPGAALSIARRGGTSATFDVMNKYFGISQMPIAGSTYWNFGHGLSAGEIQQDAEGIETFENLAKNLAWMIKSFEAAKEAGIPLPDTKKKKWTHFIR